MNRAQDPMLRSFCVLIQSQFDIPAEHGTALYMRGSVIWESREAVLTIRSELIP